MLFASMVESSTCASNSTRTFPGKTCLCQTLPEVEYFDCELPRVRRMMEDPEGFLDGLRGKRVVWGGRVGVRTALYLAALCGSPWNPALRPFYDRLRAAGKPKVALIACARKLLTILNAMVWDNAGWRAPDLPLQHSC
jgi:hypothetical protein